jgi:hypothetical protein
MLHLNRALASARIEDLRREAAQMRLARSVTHEPHMAAASRLRILSGRRWTRRRDDPSRCDRAPLHRQIGSEGL